MKKDNENKETQEAQVPNLAEMSPDELAAYVASLEAKNKLLIADKEELIGINKKLVAEKKTAKVAPEIKPGMTPAQWLEEKVPFKAFKDNNTYKDDIVAKINGDRLQIPRGKSCMIKRKFFNMLADAESQSDNAANVQIGYEDEFENNVKGHM